MLRSMSFWKHPTILVSIFSVTTYSERPTQPFMQYVIYEWPLIDQVNWISMRSFKQSSTPSRISSSIYTPFIIAFMYVMRQNF